MTDDYADSRTPPHDNDAEMAVLASMMLSKDAIAEVVQTLRPGDYYRPAHETIHDAIVDLYTSGAPVDFATVADALTKTGDIGRVGGPGYLHTLVSLPIVAMNAGYYATIVRDKATLRRVIDAGTRIAQMGYAEQGDVAGIVDAAQATLFAATPAQAAEDYRPIGDVMGDTLDHIEELQAHGGEAHGVPTGFIDLDELTGGLHPGQMIVIAARPALGKSTLALDLCRSASIRHRMTSCIFSLEMTRREISMRLLAAEAKVPLANISHGRVSDSDWQRIAAHLAEIEQAPLFIDDSPNLTMTEIRAKARRLKQTNDLRLIVIDYLQLMTSGRKVENRQTEVSEFSRQIKLLAKELEVPVVALSQLNRGPEQRTSKRPLLSDLRESGSIEQDSDVVFLLHREDAYEKESDRLGEADLIVAKHRNGPTRDVTLAFQGHFSRFVDMAYGV